MRGKRPCRRLYRRPRRIIPAHAGQTIFGTMYTAQMPDHPRACGANWLRTSTSDRIAGSSPRMRGKRDWETFCRATARIIPAHAGQTPFFLVFIIMRTDHPRACGANPRCRCSRARNCGSSPRMRGKPADGSRHAIEVRIIPAHAGQTDR